MEKRGRKPRPVINMVTKQEFESVAHAARHARVSKSKMYNHIHMVGATSINGEQYCYLRIRNLEWLKEQIERENG